MLYRRCKYNLFSLLVLAFLWLTACGNPLIQEIWDLKQVTFDTKGGSYIPHQNLFKGSKIKYPGTPVKAGFSFTGWFEDDAELARWDFNAIPEESLTLYAGWIAKIPGEAVNTPSVKLSDSEACLTAQVTPIPSNGQTLEYAISVTNGLSADSLSWQTGNEFRNLNTGTAYYVYARSKENDVYAAGTPNQSVAVKFFRINYDSKGGSAVSARYVQENDLAPEPSVTRTGHSLIGWFKEPDYINEWDFDSDLVASDITLYAFWSENDIELSVTLSMDNFTPTSPDSGTFGKTLNLVKGGGAITVTAPAGSTVNSWEIEAVEIGTGSSVTLNPMAFADGSYNLYCEFTLGGMNYTGLITVIVSGSAP